MPLHRLALISATAALGALALAATPAMAAGGDAAKGKQLFVRCAVCHALAPGQNRLGPSLAGLFGRKAGTTPGFAYSPAMKNAKISWSAASLDAFIAKPAKAIPGNKMIFAGLPNPADRADLIAYLASATKSGAR